ncbi:helix-turn-helix domain-containing protein [Streptomyces sp. P9(2023)]|uniref:winged helix-turn-helix transcriptional regulator n=1 Tax=Streptomyces sp. P9(2023) TaxID=3064394 RepID=UPI0028F41FC4|nr:helix-turn-helix domain-containing protein [Streptomyces sp. P9(2023)]MDT9690623.1 helix-turn-helix domain-containing protein [Streptomyces sp. P9(2023)]
MAVSEELDSLLAGFDGGTMCPSRLVLEHVTSRWGVLILIALSERSYRFSELRRRVGGVSEKMLTQTLQTLERDGFVHRDAKPVIPPRVDYSLTALGEEAAGRVRELARWTDARVAAVEEARARYDTARREAATRSSQ